MDWNSTLPAFHRSIKPSISENIYVRHIAGDFAHQSPSLCIPETKLLFSQKERLRDQPVSFSNHVNERIKAHRFYHVGIWSQFASTASAFMDVSWVNKKIGVAF